jgi:hypothetical protein
MSIEFPSTVLFPRDSSTAGPPPLSRPVLLSVTAEFDTPGPWRPPLSCSARQSRSQQLARLQLEFYLTAVLEREAAEAAGSRAAS